MEQTSLNQFIRCFTVADAAATARVHERLALALRDPAAYQAQFAEELAERGIETLLPAQELRDVALIDALLAEDLAWESDEQDTAADLVGALNDLLAQQKRDVTLAPNALAGPRGIGPERLDAAQDALELLGFALVLFTLDSDSYPLGVVAEAQAETVRTLAAQLGFTLAVY